ncbi:MAG TPA: hypothetical protein VFP44_15265 [Usitatibacter sp.]|nr:hypothetical protein [Usitatibacter sp.]
MLENIRRIAVCVAFAATLPTAARGADDRDALSGLREVKVVFDVKEGDGKALLSRLNTIEETRQSLIKQGVTPHIVVAFRGPATRLVQTDVEKIKPEDRPVATQIAAKLADMRGAQGVDGIEQCSVAIRQQGTKPENVVPAVKVVGNSWISLMAYQAKGYSYISP